MSCDVWLTISTGGVHSVPIPGEEHTTGSHAESWAEALGCPFKELDGQHAAHLVARLSRAVAKCSDAGARDMLEWLLAACLRHPLARVQVHW